LILMAFRILIGILKIALPASHLQDKLSCRRFSSEGLIHS
jgi:hypothetical protein